jgi:hypothetical protein
MELKLTENYSYPRYSKNNKLPSWCVLKNNQNFPAIFLVDGTLSVKMCACDARVSKGLRAMYFWR